MARVLVISDLHCDREHPRALQFLKSVRDQWKCDKVVCVGDEIDASSFSMKWPMDPDLDSPGKELDNAILHLKPFYKEFPSVELCESNHGLRIFKRARCSGIPQIVLRRYGQILQMPVGWRIYPDGFEIDGVYYYHGEGLSGASWINAHQKTKRSTVHGHLHSRGGVVYSQSRKEKFFVLNTGCLVDPKHPAFDYARNNLEKVTLGCGVVIDGEEAYFIPMRDKWR